MAKIYYPKSRSAKLIEGVIAGLIGGVVYMAVVTLLDALTPERSWWTSVSQIGGIITGQRNFNTVSPDMGSLVLGIVLTLLVFGLLGMGFPSYRPLFLRFNIHPLLGGALFGALMWLLIGLLTLLPVYGGQASLLALLAGFVLAGLAIAWWLDQRSQTTEQPRT